MMMMAFAMSGVAQEEERKKEVAAADVPAAVVATMKEKYPDRKVEKWKLKKETYAAKCEVSGRKCEVFIKADGSWKRTDTRIGKKALPEKALAHVKSTYPGYEIKWIEKREKPKSTTYRVRVKKGDTKALVKFDKDGNLKEKKD